MKKVLFVSAMFLLAFSTKSIAQDEGEFKPFKVDVSGGYAIPMGGKGGKGGVLFVVEPKYAVLPQLSVGLRLEAAVTVAGVDLNTGNYNNTASAKAAASYLATGDYYFTINDLRPFAGAGIGLFQTAGVSISSSNENVGTGSKFGGMIRAGAEYKHFRFGLEYNFIPKTSVNASSATANDGYTIQNAYVGIKIGFCIGGGRL
jgi:opacity protein-like surface antigen